MKHHRIAFALSLALLAPLALPAAAAAPASSQAKPRADVVELAVASPDHTTLVAAVKAAGLVDTLKGAGPFTVFAPTNAAFAALPAGTVDSLLQPQNKSALTGVLTYHVVSGKVDAATLAARIKAGGGKAELATVQGATLVARLDGNRVEITDAKGGKAHVVAADLAAANGVVHAIDRVLMP